jgi:hypothetical protein
VAWLAPNYQGYDLIPFTVFILGNFGKFARVRLRRVRVVLDLESNLWSKLIEDPGVA